MLWSMFDPCSAGIAVTCGSCCNEESDLLL